MYWRPTLDTRRRETKPSSLTQQSNRTVNKENYNLGLHPLSLTSLRLSSLNTRLRILPLAVLGMLGTNLTPPVSALYPASLSSNQLLTISSVNLLSSVSGRRTTYARGSSVPGTTSRNPITAASTMSGCANNTASSSGGAT